MADLPSFLRRPESDRNGNNEVYDDDDDNKDEFDDEVDDDDDVDVDVDDEEEEHFHSNNRHFGGGGGSGGEQEMMSLFGRKSMDKEKGNAGDETITTITTTAMTNRRRHQVIQLSLLTIVLFLGTLFVTLQTSGSRNHHGKASLPTRSSSHQHPHPQQHKQQGESTTTHLGPTPPTISSPPPPPQNQKGPLPRQDRCKSHISSPNGNVCYKLDLARVQDQYGIPVVLVSMDASGELEIWKQASRLINDRASVILPHEGIGRTPVEVRQHLEQRERPGECWLIDLLCHVQQKSSATQQQGQKHGSSSSSSNSGSSNSTPPVAMYGTRWKPFPPSFGFSASRAALHWIQTTMNVQRIDNEKGTNNIRGIKLIYLQRNPVDLVLERLFQQQQHMAMPTKTKIPTTTHSNDNNNYNYNYNYPKVHVPSDFLNQVKRITSIYQQARRVLNDIEGAYVFVQYEHLMYDRVVAGAAADRKNTSNTMMMKNQQQQQQQRPTREDAWTTLIRHLHPVRGTKHLFLPLAKERIPRNELVVNYNDIVTALQGTFWEQYLHDT